MVGACNGSAVGRNSRASLPPSSDSKASSSRPVLRAASTPPLTLRRLSAVPSLCSPAASTWSIRRRTRTYRGLSVSRALLLSERSPGFAPRGKDFPRRNRLISGISLGVVVVVEAERSGSLITVCGRAGRDVFTVPGSPLDPRSAGTHNLLKQGACLATNVRSCDHRAPVQPLWPRAFAPDEATAPEPLPDPRKPSGSGSWQPLGQARVDIDEVARATDVALRKVHIVLLELDLAEKLQRYGRQLVALIDRGE